MPSPIKVIAFDIMETCFSLEPLRPILSTLGLTGEKLEMLYGWTLRDGIALAAVGDYRPFPEVLAAELESLLIAHGHPPDASAIERVLAAMRTLPASADLKPALEFLRENDVRAMALTNGSASTTNDMLTHAGVKDLFCCTVSVDEVRLWKPRAEVYLHASQRAGVEPGQMALVAAHGWDCQGAKRAGLRAGWIKRKEPRYPPFMTPLDAVADSLTQVCRSLLSQEKT